MKKFILLIFLISTSFYCSNNDDNFESSAKIIGFDASFCACCGGWLIEIDENENLKRFDVLPKNATIDLQNATFPLLVNLNWTKTDTYCGNGIIIDNIELR